MKIITSIGELQQTVDNERISKRRIALVPTMGFLHDGHASLIRKARQETDVVITSIFVNPTQFAPNEDFSRYPRDLERDMMIAEEAGCDIIFAPTAEEMYPEGFKTSVKVGIVSEKFDGVFRPIHFEGVATVVLKLFLAAKPHRAYFGQKDYQQTLVIRKLVRDLNLDVQIDIVPTRREADGLAMSSRNVYLSEENRAHALKLFKALKTGEEVFLKGEKERVKINAAMRAVLQEIPDAVIDYAAAAKAADFDEPDFFKSGDDIVLLIAVRIGNTRLIDNMIIP
ncbi:MAG TPA: pantoate--beta-alanine ligase [Patescibacteria group bacterium]|nr:pantoate--beta-alanine ligase [Patescibacteria group bacterium]